MERGRMRCRNCGTEEGAFKKDSNICKKCHSKYNRNRQKFLSAERSPHKWFSCDECDEVFNVKGENNMLNTCCIYCESEEILTFAEQLGIKRCR